MAKSDHLAGKLHQLSEVVGEIIEEEEDEIGQSTRQYVRRRYFVIGDTERIVHHNDDEIEREHWSPEAVDYVVAELKGTNLYEKCKELILDRGPEERDPEDALNGFVHHLLSEDITALDNHEITGTINVFISDVENGPISYSPTVWISGITLDSSPIGLSDKAHLRKREESDLTVEYPRGLLRFRIPRYAPTAVLEFEHRGSSNREVYKERNKILSCLQLYDVASVSEIRVQTNANSILNENRFRQRFDSQRSNIANLPYKCELGDSDQSYLDVFFDIIYDLVEEEVIEKADDDYLTIAFDRYQNALEDDESNESRLTSAIMSLEALLLGHEGELSEKLARRTGILLGLFGHNAIEIRNKVKQAYEYRSRYVHGEKKEEKENISNLTNVVVDYTRQCILVFLQLSQSLDKENILNKLDNSSLHDDARKSLQEDIDKACELEQISPPS